ncbi:MAG: cytochrome c3 family protein [Caldilineaceae bacterium]
MSQLFHPTMNLIVRVVLLTIIFLLVGLGGLGYYAATSPYFTEVGVAKAQPVPFSHKQHVGGLGLDCRYCHLCREFQLSQHSANRHLHGLPQPGRPAAPSLDLVRQSAENNTPLEWVRVHNLADYVYFNHAIHVKQGVGCETCHGRIDQMPTVMKTQPLQMAWCLECHRNPENYLRPRAAVFTMGWEPPLNRPPLVNN